MEICLLAKLMIKHKDNNKKETSNKFELIRMPFAVIFKISV